MTAAHKHLPLPTYARVTNLDNGKTIVVRVNDRGPFVAGRLIDLSYVAAAKLGISGTGRVEVRAISVSPDEPRTAATPQPSAPAPVSVSGLYLQAGAFGEQHRAQAAQTRLQAQLGAAWPVSMVAAEGLWRVKIGPLPDRATAVELREQLATQGWETQLLLSPPLRLQ
jgi:rare lipoprotein A